MEEAVFFNSVKKGIYANEVISLPPAAAFENKAVTINDILYWSDGTKWINISKSNLYGEGNSLPILDQSIHVSGYIYGVYVGPPRAGGYIVASYVSDGSYWRKLSSFDRRREIPTMAFVSRQSPTIAEVQTWVNANLTDDEKNNCELFMIEDSQVMGFGLNQVESITRSVSNINLVSITINGNIYAIGKNLEVVTVSDIVLDYNECQLAKGLVESAFSTEGINVVFDIFMATTSISLMFYTKAISSHTVSFTYSNNGGVSTLNTTTRTSPSKAYTIGTTVDRPDHVWNITDGVIKDLYHRDFTGSNHFYVKKGISLTDSAYAQVGNSKRPFRSTTDALLYLGLTSFASSSSVIFLESATNAVDHINIIDGSGLMVKSNNNSNNFLVRYSANNRSVVINECLFSNIYLKCPDSVSGSSLQVNGHGKSSLNSICTYYMTYNQNGVDTSVDINGQAIKMITWTYQNISYNVNTQYFFEGSLNLYGTSVFNVSGGSKTSGFDTFKVYSKSFGTSFLCVNANILSCELTVSESSTLSLVANKILSSNINLSTDKNVDISCNVLNSEINLTKTTSSAVRPIYNITSNRVELFTVNKLPINFINNNIYDVVVNYKFTYAEDLNLFKTTGSAVHFMSNLEVNYIFEKLIMNTGSIMSWDSITSKCDFSTKGEIIYTTNSSLNLIYYSPGKGTFPNKLAFNSNILAENAASSSKIVLDARDVDKIMFSGFINVPLATVLFYTTTDAEFNLYLSGITSNASTVFSSTSSLICANILLKDFIYLLSDVLTPLEFISPYVNNLVVSQGVATNNVVTAPDIFYSGDEIVRHMDIYRFSYVL